MIKRQDDFAKQQKEIVEKDAKLKKQLEEKVEEIQRLREELNKIKNQS